MFGKMANRITLLIVFLNVLVLASAVAIILQPLYFLGFIFLLILLTKWFKYRERVKTIKFMKKYIQLKYGSN